MKLWQRLHPFLLLLGVALLALFFANVEIQIEGADGWASKLPVTFRIEGHWALNLFWGGRPLTGYHAWIFSFMLLAFHLPMLFSGQWSLKLEARALACLMLFWVIEDLLWFVLNPAYGWSRLVSKQVVWHKHWLLGLPTDYWTFTVASAVLLWYSFRRPRVRCTLLAMLCGLCFGTPSHADVPPPDSLVYRGVTIGCPLMGAPRKVSSRFRERRRRGRRHGGIDFVSQRGELVRAIADGVVVFAGIGHRRGRSSNLTPERAGRVPRRAMGIGGLFVLVDHGRQLISGYFHLGGYSVRRGDQVRAGQEIGRVGDTGMKDSPPHLHFELRVHGRNIDPARYLLPHLAPRKKPRPAPGS